ncbi:unnamed protein product [Ixodes pacificus]
MNRGKRLELKESFSPTPSFTLTVNVAYSHKRSLMKIVDWSH